MINHVSTGPFDLMTFLSYQERNLLVAISRFPTEVKLVAATDKCIQTSVADMSATSDSFLIPQLLAFVSYHFYFSTSSMLRGHLSEAFSSCRVAIDATFHAYRFIKDRASQEAYLNNDKSFRNAKQFFKEALERDSASFPLARDLVHLHETCSKFASHADFSTFAHRLSLEEEAQQFKIQYFQIPKTPNDFAFYLVSLVRAFIIMMKIFAIYLVEQTKSVPDEWRRQLDELDRASHEMGLARKPSTESSEGEMHS